MKTILMSLIFTLAQAFAADKEVSWEEVKAHKQPEACWIVIEGKVYDVTAYLNLHPKRGRKELIAACGQDATEGWQKKGERGRPHSEKAAKLLQSFSVGKLRP